MTPAAIGARREPLVAVRRPLPRSLIGTSAEQRGTASDGDVTECPPTVCRTLSEKEERGMLVSKLGALIAVGCCAALAGAGTALATTIPAPSVLATNLAAGASSGDIEITTKGPVEVTFREITIEPGGSTGWHHHAGELLAVVQAGALSRQFEDCTEVTTPAGQAFVEPAGGEHVHVGRNLGTEPVVLYVAYVLPAGSPFAEEALDPGCGP